MSELWDSFKKMFQSAEKSTPSNPLIHEVIKRSDEEKAAYELWKTKLVKRRLIDWLNQQHVNYLVNPKGTDEAIDFLNTPSSKGLVIHLDTTRYSKEEAIFLMDYLKEKVLELNYKSYTSDVRTYTKKDVVESIQRHYLKPRINFDPKKKIKQAFGNITIELLLRNEKLIHLIFRANSYQDRKFENVNDFKRFNASGFECEGVSIDA